GGRRPSWWRRRRRPRRSSRCCQRSPVLLEGEAGARPLPAFGAGVGPAGEGIGSARVAWEGRQFDGFPLFTVFTVGHHQPSSSALYPIPASHSWAWIAGTPLLMSARIACLYVISTPSIS